MRWARRLKRRLNKRVLTFAVLYALIVTVTFGIVRSGVWEEPSVPAMARPGTGTPRVSFIQRLIALFPDMPRATLRSGLPLVALVEDIEQGHTGPNTFAGIVSVFFTGVDPYEPKTFLESLFPGLALARAWSRAQSSKAPPGAEPAAEVIFRLPAPSPRTEPPLVVPSDEPVVAVYHTHSKESYLPDLALNRPLEPEDAYSDDPALNMTRVGQELVKTLQELGVGAVHSSAVHDRDGRLGAYLRSEATIQTMLKQYPSIKVLIDVHRDSQPRARTTALVRRQLMAKIMVVLGSDNKAWRENYDFALAFTKVLEEKYPGLSAGIFPTPGRFNQHYSPYALLLEFGGVENSLEEALRSARAAAEVIAYLVKAKVVR